MHLKMPSRLHDSFNSYMRNTLLEKCMYEDFFTWEQKKPNILFPVASAPTEITFQDEFVQERGLAPDGLFEVLDRHQKKFLPKIAVEVGVTQPYGLLRDMEQELLKCQTMSAVIFVNINKYNRSTIKRLHGPARERFRTLIEEWWISHIEMNLMGLLHLQKYTTPGSGQSKEILQYLDRLQSFYKIEQSVEILLEQTPLRLLSDLYASAKSANF